MRTIALSNNKGGSGKTTTTVSLAAAFAERGLRVLVVDLDPQGSATDWLGGRESPIGLVEFSAGGIRVSELVVGSTAPGVDLIPTSPSLVPSGEKGRDETGLAIVRGFARLPDYWDLILVDTPPTLGYLSLAPLVSGDQVVDPRRSPCACAARRGQRDRRDRASPPARQSAPGAPGDRRLPRESDRPCPGRGRASFGDSSAPSSWSTRCARRSASRRRQRSGSRSRGTHR